MKIVLWATALLFGAGTSHGQAAAPPAGAMEHHEHAPAILSTTLVLSAAGKTLSFSRQELQAMPHRTLTVHNGHSNVDETYTGVGVSDLLARLGLTLQGDGAKTVYHSFVRAEGTDHYWVVYSASELEPDLRNGDALVALTVDGEPLGGEGQFKLVVAGERKPAHWVRNLSSLSLVTPE